MKQIFAYYESIPGSTQGEEFGCANLWKASWENQGWTCTMLNKSHATASNLINKVMWHMIQMNLSGARLARYTRLLALHAAGGGWMSDYDVANLGFSATEATEMEKDGPHLIVGEPNYLFHATREQLNFLIKKLHDLPPVSPIYPVESEIWRHTTDTLADVKPKLFHAKRGLEKTRVQQLQEILSSE